MSTCPSMQADIDKKVYDLAWRFLLRYEQVKPEILERHLAVPETDRPPTLPGIFRHLVFTAQNYHSLPCVIGAAIGSTENLSDILCDFEPSRVVEKYLDDDWGAFLDDVVEQLLCGREPKRGPQSIWRRFCRSVLSGARFLAGFRDATRFHEWVESYDRDEQSRCELLWRLDRELHGFGFALACDFIKEMGYLNFSKPDVHLKAIFSALALAETDDDYTVFKAINRLARNAAVTPYSADKVFWLLSSGRFYHDDFTIGRHREEFICHARAELENGPW